MLKKIKDNKFIKKIFIFFLIIQPILDLKVLYSDGIIELFKFSPSTIIRMLLSLILVILVFISHKKGKTEKYLAIYCILTMLYLFLHHINCSNFSYNPTGTFNYSLFEEAYYIVRMIIPILLMYVTMNIDLTKKNMKKIFKTVTLIFSSIIILSCLFKFGIASYGGEQLKYGLLDWFRIKGLTSSDVGCQGLFAGANRLGVLLSAILPINIYFYLDDKKNRGAITIFLQILALMIIGTQVATFTWILVIIVMLVLYFIFGLLKKKIRINPKKLVILAIVVALELPFLLNSPVVMSKEDNEAFNTSLSLDAEGSISSSVNETKALTTAEKIDYIKTSMEDNSSYFWINVIYINQIYNYRIDPDFWLDIMSLPFYERHNDRLIQEKISNRIYTKNGNQQDKFLGMGYSTFKSSDLYLEKDFIGHFYTIGLFGVVLLLGIYLFTLIRAGLYIIKNIKKNFRFEFLTYCCSLSIFVFTSMICGHIVDEMITYIFMSLITGQILKQIYIPKKKLPKGKVDKKISIIVPVYNVEKYLDECLESIIKQDLPDYEVILVNDKSTDKSLEICEKYVKEHNFILINNEKNSGPAISRNKGIKEATGEFIAFVDSDDMLYQNNIQTLYNVMKKENADLVMSGLNSFNSKGKYGYYSDKYIDEYKTGSIYENKELINCISICSKLYKTELIKDVEFLENTLHEDNSFTLITYFKAKKIVVVPKHLYYRRIREGLTDSIMQNLNYKTFSDLIKNYENILNKITPEKNIKFLYKYMIRQLNNNIIKHVKEEEYEQARKDVQEFIEFINKKDKNTKYLINYDKNYFRISKLYKGVIKIAKR